MFQLKRGALLRPFFLFAITYLTYTIYSPHLSGDFILDDWPNLSPLSNIPTPTNFNDILTFISINHSGQLGRSIPLLSFALQAEYWPNNPTAFKAINLIIHLANGCLITIISYHLLLINKSNTPTLKYLPYIIAGLWLVQPIHVSTVLYTVQRMTLLMAFFSLVSLTGYLIGRNYCNKTLYKGYFISTTSLILGGTCAIFSKENGVLILLYIAIIEFTLFSKDTNKPRHWHKWLWLFIYSPLILAGIYFLLHVHQYAIGHNIKNFTITEHLLTDSRILFDYIGKILFPRPDSFGLFFDDYLISKSLFKPITTLFSCISFISLLTLAVLLKNKYSVFSYAVLWFFSGHLLESGIIPLELYFEHRNYLPSFGIIFGLCILLLFFFKNISTSSIKFSLVFLVFCYFSLITIICYKEASLWNTPKQQSLTWQNNHPLSKRANAYAAQTWIDLNLPLKADSIFQKMSSIDPLDSAPHLMRLELNCLIQHLSQSEIDYIFQLLPNTNSGFSTAQTVLKLTKRWIKNQCQNISKSDMENILLATLNNTNRKNIKTTIVSTLSLFYASNNQYQQAISLLNKTINETSNVQGLILLKIRWGIANKQYKDALEWIKQNKKTHSGIKLSNINFINQLDEMENDIQKLIKKTNPIKKTISKQPRL